MSQLYGGGRSPVELADLALYGASKAALNRITNGLAAELAGTGVRVNTVEPRAAVLSEGAAALMGETLRPDQIESMEEMVEVVVALCDCSEEVTGRVTVSLDFVAEWTSRCTPSTAQRVQGDVTTLSDQR